MILTLLKALKTDSLMEAVRHISLCPLDLDLLLYDAQENGEIEIDKESGKITALKEPAHLYYDPELAIKLVKVIKRYDEQDANITRSRLEQITLDLAGTHGYPIHDFVCTLYALEQGIFEQPLVNKYDISVPELKIKKGLVRPANTFTFYTLLDHQEFGTKAVNNYIDQFAKQGVK